MADEYDERFKQHEDILRSLTAMLVEQRTMNQRFEGYIQEQREFNRQQVEINADVKTTLVRIETLLARAIQQGENGRDA
jgi:hypothetical protein